MAFEWRHAREQIEGAPYMVMKHNRIKGIPTQIKLQMHTSVKEDSFWKYHMFYMFKLQYSGGKFDFLTS